MKVQWGHPQLRHQIHVGMKICDILSITYCILQTVNPIVTTGEKQRGITAGGTLHFLQFHVCHRLRLIYGHYDHRDL